VLRLPKSILERRRAIDDATAALVNSGRRPTTSALAAETHLSADDVVGALEAPTTMASLDAPLDDGSTLEAALADPAATEPAAAALAAVEHAALADAIGHLPSRQRAVIDARFGLSGERQTLAEIGADLHVSPARVRAIEADALHDLALELAEP
jgi:DNA-directed RNA polymerase sigma subunit (sigma70/sigma32)